MVFADMIGSSVKYRNTTTEIEVSYTWYKDLRGTPQVICGRLELKEDGGLEVAEAYNLDMIITARCPDKSLEEYPEDPIEKLEHMVSRYGTIVADCASIELNGDFTLFSALRKSLLEELKGGVFLHSGVDEEELIEYLKGAPPE
jgi:hypothetical protein